MRNYLTFLLGLAFALFSPFSVLAQQIEKPNVGPDAPASPEMARLWNAFGGDWDNIEAMERSEFFPQWGPAHRHIPLEARDRRYHRDR